jgi:hypothetical protein
LAGEPASTVVRVYHDGVEIIRAGAIVVDEVMSCVERAQPRREE